MRTGRVVRFDETRGYGFITPDDGGDDVFVHANELTDRGLRVGTGTRVKFNVLDGGRGLKAYDVLLVKDEPGGVGIISPEQVGADGPPAPVEQNGGSAAADEDVCEIFAAADFLHQITDLLIEKGPTLTGAQIGELRQHLLHFAEHNGWVE